MGENGSIEFVIYGEPMGKQRPKVSVRNGYPHEYTPKETLMYENKVAFAYKEVAKDYMFDKDDLIRVVIDVYFPLNKGDYGKKGLNKNGKYKIDQIYAPTHKDIDNICKAILDGLNGVAWLDDKQVCMLHAVKMWTQEQPRVEVHIGKLTTLL